VLNLGLDPRVIECILTGQPVRQVVTSSGTGNGPEPTGSVGVRENERVADAPGSSPEYGPEISEEIRRLAAKVPEERIDMVALARTCLGIKP
jgi:hypothetical protein